mmetsp:Transcript_10544/g.18647  ORF Transcript_10544/g.18647 Transcript_10544/m.18647 type:complete len:312 (+) Transcript_10544:8408-9343(+)
MARWGFTTWCCTGGAFGMDLNTCGGATLPLAAAPPPAELRYEAPLGSLLGGWAWAVRPWPLFEASNRRPWPVFEASNRRPWPVFEAGSPRFKLRSSHVGDMVGRSEAFGVRPCARSFRRFTPWKLACCTCLYILSSSWRTIFRSSLRSASISSPLLSSRNRTCWGSVWCSSDGGRGRLPASEAPSRFSNSSSSFSSVSSSSSSTMGTALWTGSSFGGSFRMDLKRGVRSGPGFTIFADMPALPWLCSLEGSFPYNRRTSWTKSSSARSSSSMFRTFCLSVCTLRLLSTDIRVRRSTPLYVTSLHHLWIRMM